ncbi:quinol monooxygenase YgiN [Aeromicrobium sp. SORGH_AS981]|uniref:hypothetical protein n=1 Tax=Aeromicrobium sp. SORGH_AS_0981 TaxID=3041802 RepID=UPI00285D885E|nr:hypothetical protein [Aeromicrobium sp. SORGH_AS_0981]MDR6119801.1 quinol monooxygenase YgiN [Aeromicrobium sp. SORGH_AS_0981]
MVARWDVSIPHLRGQPRRRVLTDVEDPTHVTAFERWESLEHDAAYRTWRAGDGRRPALAALLAAPPVLTHWDTPGD